MQQCVCTSSEGFDGFLSDKLFLLAADHKINKKAQRLFNSLPEALSHMHTETLSERQLSACYGSTVEGFLLKLIQWLQPLDWSRGDKCTHIHTYRSTTHGKHSCSRCLYSHSRRFVFLGVIKAYCACEGTLGHLELSVCFPTPQSVSSSLRVKE